MLKDGLGQDSIDMRTTPNYSFTIDKSNPASFGANRFQLVIRQNPTFAFKLLNFDADKTNAGSLIGWKTKNESNYTTFFVQRNTDDRDAFEPIGSMQSNGSGNYSFVDKNPATGPNYYRLQMVDINSNISYSKSVTLAYPAYTNIQNAKITVFPNPTSKYDKRRNGP